MIKNYTAEKHTQILIALLKEHGVRKIIASPGATNVCLVGSLQSDPFFEIYSSVDERSAAYMACGMAAESGESVAITCTGSTASRNYLPGLTEAYYRKLPVLAITTAQHFGRIGNYAPQVIDRSTLPNDVALYSTQIDCVNTAEDEWACEVEINKALLALTKNGGGPAHINLRTTYNSKFSVTELPAVKKITHIEDRDSMPEMEPYSKIVILVGAHRPWTENLYKQVEIFCEKYNAVVLHNHVSNYRGKYGVGQALIMSQENYRFHTPKADLVIYIGSVSRYHSGMQNADMWRVNPDGMIRDPEKILTKVFQMDEEEFFTYYNEIKNSGATAGNAVESYAKLWKNEYQKIINNVPELPFSNVWVAKTTIADMPENSVWHIAGSNTARAWNFFEKPQNVICFSNDGAMGIDGQVSALVGESLASPQKIHIGVVGDLTFFYDMNCIGNRHINNNFRLMIINNGKGAEFKIYNHPAYPFEEDGDKYMAAAGHFGNKSPNLIQEYVKALGFEYFSASSKEEYLKIYKKFVSPVLTDKPIIFEVFTESKKENEAIYLMNHCVEETSQIMVGEAKKVIKKMAGDTGVDKLKKILKKN